MKKELTNKELLLEFLHTHCEIKPVANPLSHNKRQYILDMHDCVLFMAEAYIQALRNVIGQTHEVMLEAKRTDNYSEVLTVYNWSAPSPGIDTLQIPEAVIEKLTSEQASVFLSNLTRIKKDIQEGRTRKEQLSKLLGKEAHIATTYTLDGTRLFLIHGSDSPTQKKRYAEKYLEAIATNVLFDLPKALNARLKLLLPDFFEETLFLEGRYNFHWKLRYGDDANTELSLTDAGAKILCDLTQKSDDSKKDIKKILRQAVTDPFGFSLKYYLGKHPLITL